MTSETRPRTGGFRTPPRRSRLARFGLPVLILAAGVLGAQVMIAGRPEVPKVEPQATPTLVETVTVRAHDDLAVIPAYGTVRAHRRLTVFPRVEGYVTAQHENLISGGMVRAGDTLIDVDARDYELAVETERGNLARAEFELRVEEGSQVVAEREWALLEPSIETSDMGRRLALREPHLIEKRAAVAAARSRLAQAELNLQRTRVRAPCNALVLDEDVEPGQLVNARSPVATLVCTDVFRVEVSLALDRLHWVTFPTDAESAGEDGPEARQGSVVRIRRDLGTAQAAQWTGRVDRLLGDVTENGRMARLLVLVPDPLGHAPGDAQLLLGEYVRVEIMGPRLEDALSLPRHALREGDRVWVHDADDRLEVRRVDVVLRRDDTVIVRRGVAAGERVIVSPLPAALPGLWVQAADDALPTSAEPETGSAGRDRKG